MRLDRVCATVSQHMALYDLFAYCSLACNTKDLNSKQYVPKFRICMYMAGSVSCSLSSYILVEVDKH